MATMAIGNANPAVLLQYNFRVIKRVLLRVIFSKGNLLEFYYSISTKIVLTRLRVFLVSRGKL